jgi:hypothetical protein
MEIRPAPGLLDRHLGELHAALLELREQTLNVGDLDAGEKSWWPLASEARR